MDPLPAPIVLERMLPQTEIETPDDDWTGQSNQAERKRRQNRLNQRAYRKRKEAQLLQTHVQHTSPINYPVESVFQPANEGSKAAQATKRQEQAIDLDPEDTGPWQSFSTAIASTQPQFPSCLKQFQKWIARNHMTSSPTADQVLVLIKFNIFRALCNNALMLGFPIEFTMEDNALSPFTPKSKYEKYLTSPERILEIPGNLRPTALQCEIPHHPWVDLLPVPRMRDNLILAEDTYDGFELCEDLCKFCVSVLPRNGLIIWGDPWDPTGWEMTPQFLKRWAWTVDGCTELLHSTNYWRQRRGEKALRFEKVFSGFIDGIS
ncbi:hypothetical protein BGZ57DRAFT_754133 [Hyaloscypha finlandica]|nr:hypothetical protein BGZ57DRAFT_754133 [Hyaloscypha finlandica]